MDLAQCHLSGALTLPRYGACWQLNILYSWVFNPGPNLAAAFRENTLNTASVKPASQLNVLPRTCKGQIELFTHTYLPFQNDCCQHAS